MNLKPEAQAKDVEIVTYFRPRKSFAHVRLQFQRAGETWIPRRSHDFSDLSIQLGWSKSACGSGPCRSHRSASSPSRTTASNGTNQPCPNIAPKALRKAWMMSSSGVAPGAPPNAWMMSPNVAPGAPAALPGVRLKCSVEVKVKVAPVAAVIRNVEAVGCVTINAPFPA